MSRVVLAFFLSLPWGCTAFAQTNDSGVSEDLDEIVVVAHKQKRSIRDVAASVSVFDSDNARFELANSMADILRYTPGIDFESAGNRFGSESINIRGVSGNRVAVLIDGVPLSDQFDVGSFSNATRDFVNAGLIDTIEVLRGPASALYGSSAIGGVVAVRTPTPDSQIVSGTHGGSAFATFEDENDSARITAMQAATWGGFSALVGASYQEGSESKAAAVDEQLDDREFDTLSGLAKFVLDTERGDSWTLGFYRQQSDVTSALQSMLGSGRFRSTTALLGDDSYRSDIVNLEFEFSDVSFIDDGLIRAYVQDTDVLQETYDERGNARRPVAIDRLFSFSQQTQGIELNLQKSVSGKRANHQLGAGLEFRRRQTQEFRDGTEFDLTTGATTKTLLGEVFPLRDFPISETREWGAYAEDVASFGRWSVIAAMRADWHDMQPTVDSMYREDYPFAEPVSLSQSELSPKLGLIFRPDESTELWMQYAHGFRAPPYEDANVSLEIPLFNYRAIPNPDLRPERSDGIDLGMRWRGSRASVDFSVFRTEYKDLIESRVRLGPDPESGRILFQAQNISRARIEGAEVGITTRFGESQRLALDANLYWARGEDKSNGESLNSVGPPQAVVGLDWSSADLRWRAGVKGIFTKSWSERDESGGELFKTPGTGVLDLLLSHQLAARMTLRASISNLTDRTYWSWSDVRGLAPDDPVLPFLSRPGRSFSVGVDVSW